MSDKTLRERVGTTWPEQDAVEKWWAAHRQELKEAVTAYRLKVQAAAPAPARAFLDVRDEQHFQGDGIEYIRRRAAKHETNYANPKQAAYLYSLADDLERRIRPPAPAREEIEPPAFVAWHDGTPTTASERQAYYKGWDDRASLVEPSGRGEFRHWCATGHEKIGLLDPVDGADDECPLCKALREPPGLREALEKLAKEIARGPQVLPAGPVYDALHSILAGDPGEALREAFVETWIHAATWAACFIDPDGPDFLAKAREKAEAEAERRYPRQPAPSWDDDPLLKVKETYAEPAPEPKETLRKCTRCSRPFKGESELMHEDGKLWHIVGDRHQSRCGPVEPEEAGR